MSVRQHARAPLDRLALAIARSPSPVLGSALLARAQIPPSLVAGSPWGSLAAAGYERASARLPRSRHGSVPPPPSNRIAMRITKRPRGPRHTRLGSGLPLCLPFARAPSITCSQRMVCGRPLGNTDTGLFIDPRIPECPFKDLQAPGQTEKDGDGVLEMTTSMQMLAASMPMPENADANAVDQTSPAEQTEGCSPFEASSLYATSFSGKSYATKDGHTDTSPSQGSERSGKSSPRSGAGQGSMTTVYRSGGNWTGGNCSIPHSLGASDAGHLPRAVEKAKPLPRENGLQQSDSRSNGNIGSKAKQPPDIKMVRKCLLLWKTKLVRMPVPNYLLAQGNGTDNHSGEQPGWLGVEFMNRPDGHLIITKIAPGGPADDNQGILVGDVLQAINDTVVRKLSPDEMRKLIKGMFEVKE